MKNLVLLVASATAVWSQSTFEPSDFNITEALLRNGVDLASLTNTTQLMGRALPSGCSAVCKSLEVLFGSDQLESQSQPAYNDFINTYWAAQQREIFPQCVFKPKKALDISTSILLSRFWQCQFAVKSGGHSAVPGGSNMNNGLTISFENMGEISLSSDKKIASLQPGRTWEEVYTTLQTDNLTVVGGRAASVGVGGLLLGGGISYFSGIYGLACDNIQSYELVTASGLILQVNKDAYPDLYWALRGGGNNFGIVTKFNLATIPRAPNMWGGTRAYLESAFPAIIDAYYNLAINAKKDGKAHQIVSFGWSQVRLAAVELEYADPVTNASVMAEYNAIPNPIQDGIAIRSLAELSAIEDMSASRSGLRQSFWTFTTKLDKDLATTIKDIFYDELNAVLDAADLIPAVSLQVISEPELEKVTMNGGNALGLSLSDGPLLLGLVSLKWTNKADDVRLNQFSARVKDRVNAAAAAKGKSSSYLYMNYASGYQDPIAGYGPANKAKLKAIAQKYDPTRVFQTLQPNYFKLDGAPFTSGP